MENLDSLPAKLPRLLYNVAETAEMLNVDQKTVYRLLKRGLLKASSALRHKLITADSILAFVRDTTK